MKTLLSLSLIAATLFSLAGCNQAQRPSTINQQAALSGSLPYNPLSWQAITSWTNDRANTMSTLYGNAAAVNYARTVPGPNYPEGSVLALVTWLQRDDPHWFGARIPSTAQSVEFVIITPNAPTYELYQGTPLAKRTTGDPGSRINTLLSRRAAVTP